MNLRSISKQLLIAIFLVFIFAPPIKTLFTPRITWSFSEKRKLAEPPALQLDWQTIEDGPKQFESYYNDHFGFRQWLIQRYNRHMRHYFDGTAINPYVLSGNDGWLYYIGDRLMDDFLGSDALTPEELEILRSNLERKHQWLAERGVKYLFVIAPDKQSIYPEHMPEDIRKARGRSRFDQLADHLKNHSDIAFLDLRGPLLDAKNRQQLYYRTDTHWTIDGAFLAYRQIMDRIQQLFPGLSLTMVTSIDGTEILDRKGDIANMIQLEDHLADKILVPNFVDPCARRQKFTLDGVKPQYTGMSTCEHAQLRVVFFCDSFGNYLRPFFSESFASFAKISRPYDHRLMLQLMDKLQPQLVIEQIAERFLVRVKPPEQSIVADPIAPARENHPLTDG